MSSYKALASSYDRLTEDVDYSAIYNYLWDVFHKHGRSPSSLLDLGCGTASVSLLFAEQGIAITALDCSEDMLTQAAAKAQSLPPKLRPQFLCCRMQQLSLPHPVDCAISSLDSMNYVLSPEDLCEIFSRVYANLKPGGLLVFDLNTPLKFRLLDGQIFLDEDDDVYCVWRASFEEETHIMTYGMDLFQRSGDSWFRSMECHEEYAYEPEQVETMLRSAGFSKVSIYGNRSLNAPDSEEYRIWIAAEKE